MQEVFYEETAKVCNEQSATKRYNLFFTFEIVSYLLAFLFFLIFAPLMEFGETIVFDLLIIFIPCLLFIGIGLLFRAKKQRSYVDFDYTFASGTVAVSKVIKNIKRKFMFKFDVKDIKRFGKYGSETYLRYKQIPEIKEKVLTSNSIPTEEKKFYYIYTNISGEDLLLIFECTKTFITYIYKFSTMGTMEDNFL